MSILPTALVELIDALQTLPGVGQRSAQRYGYSLFKRGSQHSDRLAKALANIHSEVKVCPITFALIDNDQEMSEMYTDPSRDKTLVAVVEDAFDILSIENTGNYKGTYHVLGGLISPIDGIGPETLHIDKLVERVLKDGVIEVILATSSSVEGESTAHYIQSQLQDSGCDVTRLARGLPIGLDIEYADQITLGRALEGRQKI